MRRRGRPDRQAVLAIALKMNRNLDERIRRLPAQTEACFNLGRKRVWWLAGGSSCIVASVGIVLASISARLQMHKVRRFPLTIVYFLRENL